jgi:fibronectin type 3 domain-containing protein
MKTNHLYLLLALILGLPSIIIAQDIDSTKEHRLTALTRYSGSAIEIRWAPTSKQLWAVASKKGFVLQRRTSDFQTWQTIATLKPYSLQEWKSKTDTSNVYVATAAQALLGATTINFDKVQSIQEALRLSEEQEAMFAFGLLSADYNKQAAEGLALRYDDKDIVKGKAYTYRLYINDFAGSPANGLKNDTLIFTVSTDIVNPMPKVKNVYTEAADGEIMVKWDRQFNDRFFSGFWIDKSSDNGKSWQRLTDVPHNTSKTLGDGSEHMYRDTQVVNYKNYRYKITGITPFAIDGLPSDEIISAGVDLSGPMPPSNVRAKDAGNGSILIEWDADVSAKDHGGFLIERALNATGPYELITGKALAKNARSFTDKSPTPVVANYYMVYATDDKGNRNGSAPIVVQWVDTIPPAKPMNLDGVVDSNGIVTLTWDMGTELDLLGYRVFYSNEKNREFFQLTTEVLKGNLFLDSVTLSTLSRNIYYYVVAMDRNYNPSEWSDILELTRPDIIPPQAPVLSSYSSEDVGILLTWFPSTSSDVASHTLWRKENGSDKWESLMAFGKVDSAYLDDNITKGLRYSYALSATDEAGLESPKSNILHVDAVDRGLRPGVEQFKGNFIKSEKALQLDWIFNGDANVRFVLLRNDGDGFSMLATLGGDLRTYKDPSLYRNEVGFEYILQVVYPDGGSSASSNKVLIQF